MLLVIFAGVFGSGTTTVDGVKVDTARFFVPGIVTMSIITAAYAGLMIRTANAREYGLLKRRRATPVPAAMLLGGQAAATLVTTVSMAALLLVIARLGYGVGLSAGALAATGCTVVVGTLAFACLGYAVAGVVGNADAAQPIAQATMMPLYFISGVWIPTDQLPNALQKIASLFPIEHLAAAAHLASVRTSFSAAISPKDLAAAGRLGAGRGGVRRAPLQLAAGDGEGVSDGLRRVRCDPAHELLVELEARLDRPAQRAGGGHALDPLPLLGREARRQRDRHVEAARRGLVVVDDVDLDVADLPALGAGVGADRGGHAAGQRCREQFVRGGAGVRAPEALGLVGDELVPAVDEDLLAQGVARGAGGRMEAHTGQRRPREPRRQPR